MEREEALTLKPTPVTFRLLLAPILLLCLALLVLAACEREREAVPAAPAAGAENAAAERLGEIRTPPAGELAGSFLQEAAPAPARTA